MIKNINNGNGVIIDIDEILVEIEDLLKDLLTKDFDDFKEDTDGYIKQVDSLIKITKEEFPEYSKDFSSIKNNLVNSQNILEGNESQTCDCGDEENTTTPQINQGNNSGGPAQPIMVFAPMDANEKAKKCFDCAKEKLTESNEKMKNIKSVNSKFDCWENETEVIIFESSNSKPDWWLNKKQERQKK